MIPASGITPEFLVYSLQAQLGRILSRARGANTEGLTLEALKSLDMPKPLPELVERFRIACAEIRGITDATILGNRICVQTTISLSAHAFSGHLTSDWREAHMDNLAFESRERDATLKQAGAVISLARQSMPPEAEVDLAPGTEPLRASLNREQLALLNYIIDWVKAKDNESGEEGKRPRYFTAESIGKALDGPLRRNPHAIEGHLAVFAARGLVIPVSREEQTENTGEYVFGNAYRLPNGARQVVFKAKNGQPIALESGKDFIEDPTMGDRSRTREMERLVIQLEKERALT